MPRHDNSGTPSSCNHKTRGRRRWGRRALLSLGLLLGLGGVAVAAGPTMHHQHPHTPEEARAHVDGMIDHLIARVEGSEAQRTALKAIAGRITPQMEAFHGEAHDIKVELHDLLTADKIDREALEVARKDALDLADRGSKLMLAGLADAAETLTPAQRRQIAETLARFGR